jgi:hypothetical protein
MVSPTPDARTLSTSATATRTKLERYAGVTIVTNSHYQEALWLDVVTPRILRVAQLDTAYNTCKLFLFARWPAFYNGEPAISESWQFLIQATGVTD